MLLRHLDQGHAVGGPCTWGDGVASDNDKDNCGGGTTTEEESLLSWITAQINDTMRKNHARVAALMWSREATVSAPEPVGL